MHDDTFDVVRWRREGRSFAVAHGGDWIAAWFEGEPGLVVLDKEDGHLKANLKVPQKYDVIAWMLAPDPKTLVALCWRYEGWAEDIMRIMTVTYEDLAEVGEVSDVAKFADLHRSRVDRAQQFAEEQGLVIETEDLQWQLGDRYVLHRADHRAELSALVDRQNALMLGRRGQPIDALALKGVHAVSVSPSGEQVVVARDSGVALYDL